jgi:enoyl-CoA hydratase/carnithine racemase
MTKYVYFNSPDEYKGIIYEPGRVTRIKLNRPRYLNAISHPTYAEIDDAFERFANDPEAKVAVLSGEGNCFCAGHDAMGLTPESAPMLADRRNNSGPKERYGCNTMPNTVTFYSIYTSLNYTKSRSRPSPWCTGTAYTEDLL